MNYRFQNILRLIFLVSCGFMVSCGNAEPPAGTQSEPHQHLDAAEVTTEVEVAIVPSEIVTGPNRFAVGIFDAEGSLILDAEVHLHYYDLSDEANAVLESEVETIPIQDADGYTTIFTHNREFERSGQWGLEIDVYLPDGNTAKERIGFFVEENSPSIAPGETAPGVNTLNFEQAGGDYSRLTSAETVIPALHELSLNQALANEKPTLLLFATPAYCQTRFCGPSYEIFGEVEKIFGERLNYVYVEVFDNLPNPASTDFSASPAYIAFGLESEPWFYFIDSDGVVVFRLEGIFTAEEIEKQVKERFGF